METRGRGANVLYDHTKLTYQGTTYGDWFVADGHGNIQTQTPTNVTNGSKPDGVYNLAASFQATDTSDANGLTGTGLLATLTFKTITPAGDDVYDFITLDPTQNQRSGFRPGR